MADRVLLANKWERDKKKLAGKWEVYSVVSVTKATHTFQIRSPMGSVKTIHRNLIVPVNFLLLFDIDGDEELLSLSGGSESVACSSLSSGDDASVDRTVR